MVSLCLDCERKLKHPEETGEREREHEDITQKGKGRDSHRGQFCFEKTTTVQFNSILSRFEKKIIFGIPLLIFK